MTRRVVGVWVRATTDDATLSAAMLEDVVDMVAAMPMVEPALVVPPSGTAAADAAAWPGTAVVAVDEDASLADALAALAAAGADEAAVVVPDVPDLPPLLLGKLFSALTSTPVAVCPAEDGRVVALAAQCPAPGWLADALAAGDEPDAVDRLRAAAPPRGLHVGPGWHRVRGVADLDRLDPGLEGWDATRALLDRRPS